MKKIVTLLCLLSLGAAGAALADEKHDIVYAFDHAFPPFTYMEEGQPKGFEIDVIKEALAGSGFNLTLRPGIWGVIQKDLKAGKVQLSSGAAKTPERQKTLLFPERSTCALDVRIYTKSSSTIHTAADLAGRAVATQRGSLYHQILEKMGRMNLVLCETEPEALQAMYNGQADACVIAGATGAFYIKERGYKNVSAVGTPLQVTAIYYLVTRDRPDLAKAIGKGLTAIQQDGRYEKIFRRWFVPKLTNEEIDSLVKAAKGAGRMAYAPYSKFQVGAAVMTNAGEIHTGCNVENAMYNLTSTALEVAVMKAVSHGDTDFKAVVNVLPDGTLAAPSAADRQILYEFNRGVQVIMRGPDGQHVSPTVAELIPYPFDMR